MRSAIVTLLEQILHETSHLQSIMKIPPLAAIERGNVGAPCIIFLHGFLGSKEEWTPIMEALSPTFHCWAVDLPGHGETPAVADDEAYSFEGMRMALAAFMERVGMDQSHWVGYSMGGRLAWSLAVERPGWVKRVAIESAAPGRLDDRQVQARERADDRWAARFEREPIETVLADWYAQPVFASLRESPAALARMIAARSRNQGREVARAMRGTSVARQPSYWDRLSTVSVPVLMLVGEQDVKYRRVARHVLADSDSIEVATIAGAGHNIHWEAPARVAMQLAQWFSRDNK